MRRNGLLWWLSVLPAVLASRVIVDVDDRGEDRTEQAMPSSFGHVDSDVNKSPLTIVDVDDRGDDHVEQTAPSSISHADSYAKQLPLTTVEGDDQADQVTSSFAHVDLHVKEPQLTAASEKQNAPPSAMLQVGAASFGQQLPLTLQNRYWILAICFATMVAFMGFGVFLCSDGSTPPPKRNLRFQPGTRTREESLDDMIRAVVQENPEGDSGDRSNFAGSSSDRAEPEARSQAGSGSDVEGVTKRAQTMWTSFISLQQGPSSDDDMVGRSRAQTDPVSPLPGAGRARPPRSSEVLVPLLEELRQLAAALEGPVQKYPKAGRSFLGHVLQNRYVVVMPQPRPGNGSVETGPELDLERWLMGHLAYWDSEQTYASRGRPKGSIALAYIESVRRGKQPEAVKIEHRLLQNVCTLKLLFANEAVAASWVDNFTMLLDRIRGG